MSVISIFSSMLVAVGRGSFPCILDGEVRVVRRKGGEDRVAWRMESEDRVAWRMEGEDRVAWRKGCVEEGGEARVV